MVDIIDVAPTLLQIAGTSFETTIDGKTQLPVAGKSFLPTLSSSTEPARGIHRFLGYGIIGRSWRADAMHKEGTSFDSDTWQLLISRPINGVDGCGEEISGEAGGEG